MKSRIIIVFVSAALGLCIAEFILQYIKIKTESEFVWQPGLNTLFEPDSSIFIGISGTKHFTINQQGTRGEIFERSTTNYLCVGGSTTECLYLDDSETWPAKLGDCLNSEKNKVASIGKSGCTTTENYLHIKYFVPQLKTVSNVIVMCGLNDLMHLLSTGESCSVNDSIEMVIYNEIFLNEEKTKKGWRKFEILVLLRHLLFAKNKTENWKIQDPKGTIYNTWRSNRANCKQFIDTLPNLSADLNNFENNLELIYNETQKQGVKLTLVNQTTLYKDSMNNFEEGLLWMGGIGDFQKNTNHAYYTTKVLLQAVDLYNNRMMEFCSKHKDIQFIDIACVLPKDTTVFYDDCHFNQSGAEKVAAVICSQIR